ncbi:MAG: hypothetical protein ACK5OC_13915 [Pirellula sp.]|jgi:hypothetical protein
MICEHLNNGVCAIATRLAGNDVLPILSQCEYCTEKANPSQSINKVTVSLAISGTTDMATKAHVMKSYGHLLTKVSVEASGPGTELKKLISWFYSPDKKKCKCATRIAKMNAWGPDKCEQRMDTIVRWLKHSARIHKVPFFEPAVKLLIKKAIKNSRSQLQQHQGKTAHLPIASHPSKPVDGIQ